MLFFSVYIFRQDHKVLRTVCAIYFAIRGEGGLVLGSSISYRASSTFEKIKMNVKSIKPFSFRSFLHPVYLWNNIFLSKREHVIAPMERQI